MPLTTLKGGQYKVLTEEQVKDIHLATLEVMAEVGVRVEHRKALEIYRDHGCDVDFDTRIVRVPEHVLRRALLAAPSRFTLCGKSPEWDVKVDVQHVWTIGGSSALYVYDLERRRVRATLRHLEELTILQDALEHLHIMHGIVNPQDIPQPGFDRRLFATVVPRTSRNYYSQSTGAQGVRDQVEMAAVIQGNRETVRQRPIFTIVLCMISPLTHPHMRVEELLACAELGVPVYVEVDAQPGGTTPVTLAGTLVEQNANVLTGITLAQLARPGLPCIYSIASGIMDMSTGNYSGGAPDTTLLHAATAQVAHYYDLPYQGGTGIDATVPDAQAGYERALQVLGNALAGTNFIHLSIGMVEQMLTASYEQCIIDNEILGAALHVARGIEVTPETLAVEPIRQAGPGGSFLAHEHTLEHFRRSRWFPKLTSREKWERWAEGGSPTMADRANQVARTILAEHHPQYIAPDQQREIERMAVAFQNEQIKAAEAG